MRGGVIASVSRLFIILSLISLSVFSIASVVGSSGITGLAVAELNYSEIIVSNTSITNNVCTGLMNGIQSVVYPCVAEDIDGRDITQFINLSWIGETDIDLDWFFSYESNLESAVLYYWNDKVINNVLSNSELISNITSVVEIDLIPEEGDLISPTIVYNVTINSYSEENKTYNDSSIIIGADSVINLGNGVYNFSWSTTQSKIVGWQELTSNILVSDNLLSDEKTYYKVIEQLFTRGELTQLKWVYTPKDNSKSGEWQIFANPSTTNLTKAINDNNYFYMDPWWNTTWQKKKQLTINYNNIDEVLSNFTILIELNSSNFNFNSAKTNGEDIRFTDSSDSTELKYEIEYWNKTSEKAIIWVKIPSISNTTTTSIYMYYNNSAATDNQDATNTWDANFKAVWHLQGTLDSTNNDKDLTASGATTYSNGKLAGSYTFDGSNDYLGSSLVTSVTDDWTMSAWVYLSSTSVSGCFVHNGKGTYTVQDGYSMGVGNGVYTTAGNNLLGLADQVAWKNFAYAIGPAGWHYVVVKRSGGTWYAYVDGAQSGTTFGGAPNTPTDNTWIGGAGSNNPGAYFNGKIDEVSISNTGRSAAWVKANYYSTNRSLITFGDEESNNTYANESEGDTAIEQGIRNQLGNQTMIYSNQKIYITNSSGSQQTGTFDKVVINGNITWAFNYITSGENKTNMNNITNAVYIWEEQDKTTNEITTAVSNYINNTQN